MGSSPDVNAQRLRPPSIPAAAAAGVGCETSSYNILSPLRSGAWVAQRDLPVRYEESTVVPHEEPLDNASGGGHSGGSSSVTGGGRLTARGGKAGGSKGCGPVRV